MKQYISWTHRFGTETHFVDCPRINGTDDCWAVLLHLGCDIEPESILEFIEDFGVVEFKEVSEQQIAESVPELKKIIDEATQEEEIDL